uniref:Uncharacterized protein n=1 Tax=Proboscia inermis TaxID=420281 RepID=A0A6T8H0L3_9STRA
MLGQSLEHNYGALLNIRPNLRQNSRPQRCPIMINLCMVHMFPTVGRSNRSRSCVPALPSCLRDACVRDLLPLPKAHLNNPEKANKLNHQNLFLFQKLLPRSASSLPHGTIIYNTICDFICIQLEECTITTLQGGHNHL